MKRSLLAGIAAAVVGFGAITFAAPGKAVPEPSHITGQILVKFTDQRAAPEILRKHGLREGPAIGSTGAHLITVPAGKELQLVQALGRHPAVEYAEPDQMVIAATNDKYFPSQYALYNEGQSFNNTNLSVTVTGGPDAVDADVDAVEAWTVTTGSGIPVAVLDTGVDSNHEDIAAKVVGRKNFSTAKNSEDEYGHGTHVAGIVAATANNTHGVAGVCPGCTILDGKVLNDSGMGAGSALANGISWAVGAGAKVINMSLVMRASRTLEAAVNNAWSKGVVLVAAAGNSGNEYRMYPAAYPNVIAVAATDNKDTKASFSSYGASWVDIAAPGVSVYSTFPNHPFALGGQYNRSMNYDILSGTSMAAPIVAATAALAWSKDPGATGSVIRTTVESGADPIDGTGTYWAHGRVNVNNAVTASAPAPGP